MPPVTAGGPAAHYPHRWVHQVMQVQWVERQGGLRSAGQTTTCLLRAQRAPSTDPREESSARRTRKCVHGVGRGAGVCEREMDRERKMGRAGRAEEKENLVGGGVEGSVHRNGRRWVSLPAVISPQDILKW